MAKSYWMTGKQGLVGALCLTGLVFSGVESGFAQAANLPRVPVLSLVKEQPGIQTPEFDAVTGTRRVGNETEYPDHRLWVRGATDLKEPEILVPVLMRNCWNSSGGKTVQPITSFKFKVQFDERALEFIGVQKNGPLPQDTFSMARNFNIDWSVAKDTNYQRSLGVVTENRLSGRRVMIVGSSQTPLAPSYSNNNPDPFNSGIFCEEREFQELLYLKFRVKWKAGQASLVPANNTPIMITQDTLVYQTLADTLIPGQFRWPEEANPQRGLEGPVSNIPNEISRPGTVYLRLTDSIPAIGFAPDSTSPTNKGEVFVDNSSPNRTLWALRRPIYSDSADGAAGRRTINLVNLVRQSRLLNVRAVSDQPWLKFRINSQQARPVSDRETYVKYIDNGILGVIRDIRGTVTTAQELLGLEIECDPNELPKDPNEGTGRYVGYITFSSESLEYGPVRLRVEFINFRTPIEPEVNQGTGIRLRVENSRGEVRNLMFGTGDRATDGVDTLFAEGNAQAGLDAGLFGVRFFTPDDAAAPNGLVDLSGVYNSRDIRSSKADTTLIFRGRFNSGVNQGGAPNYPIVISWNTDDFPEGGQLFIRDTLNGEIFALDMREGTLLPDGSRSVTIRDARVQTFVIEYTPPTAMEIPELNVGWNLVSLPVRPSDPDYRKVFRGASQAPRFFGSTSYPTEPNGRLRVGVGYFVRYVDANLIDRVISGTRFSEIGVNTPFNIRVESNPDGAPGWNAIGALSYPTDISNIDFTAETGDPELVGLVYRYETNRGYIPTNTIEPGMGYWIQVANGVGRLEMRANRTRTSVTDVQGMFNGANAVSVRDNAQHEGTLYIASGEFNNNINTFALPPVPPVGAFDVRFENDKLVAQNGEGTVLLHNATFPVVVSMENPDANYVVANAITGEVLGVIAQGKTGSVRISDERVGAVRLFADNSAEAVTGLQNYPNPVSQETTVKFNVRQAGNVTLKLYNSLGQEVKTLFNGFKPAGMHTVNVETLGLTAGTYIYKLQSGSQTETNTMVIVK